MDDITLEAASIIVDEALEKGREMDFQPLTVAVLTKGGQLKAYKSEDESGILREKICVGKAWGVLGMGFGGREMAKRVQHVPWFFGALSDMSGGKVVPVPGGVLIRNDKGKILGAVGITGDTSENDEIAAVAGVEAAGLKPDTGG